MKLYLLSQTVNTGYDTYDSCVVCAETEDDARMIHPKFYDEYSKSVLLFNDEKGYWVYRYEDNSFEFSDDTWCAPKDISVKLIGTADKSIQKGVICTSFNAG